MKSFYNSYNVVLSAALVCVGLREIVTFLVAFLVTGVKDYLRNFLSYNHGMSC